jgi:hypothetical protein
VRGILTPRVKYPFCSRIVSLLMENSRGGLQADRIGDLSHAGTITTTPGRLADVGEDVLLPLGQHVTATTFR